MASVLVVLCPALPRPPQADSVSVDCNQCMPCETPPCYSASPPPRARARMRAPSIACQHSAHSVARLTEDDGVYSYSSNSPGAGYTSISPCWQQRHLAADQQHTQPPKSGWRGQTCRCPADYVELEYVPNGFDEQGNQLTRIVQWYHRHCTARALGAAKYDSYECACAAETRTTTKVNGGLLANDTSVGASGRASGESAVSVRELISNRSVVAASSSRGGNASSNANPPAPSAPEITPVAWDSDSARRARMPPEPKRTLQPAQTS